MARVRREKIVKHWSYTCVTHVIVFAIAFLIAIPAFAQDNRQTKASADGHAGDDPASTTAAAQTPGQSDSSDPIQLIQDEGVWIAVCVGVILFCFVAFIASVRSDMKWKREGARIREIYKSWEKRFHHAMTLGLETDNFSDIACHVVAEMKRQELLKNAGEIEGDEARRLSTEKLLDAEYAQIADWAVFRCNQDKRAIVEMLRQADRWPYRLLQEAKKIVMEAKTA